MFNTFSARSHFFFFFFFLGGGGGDKKAWARDVSSDGKFLPIQLLAPKRLTRCSNTKWNMVKMMLAYLFWQWNRKRWLKVFPGQRWCYVRQIQIDRIYVIDQFTNRCVQMQRKLSPERAVMAFTFSDLLRFNIQNAYVSYFNVGPVQVKLCIERHA